MKRYLTLLQNVLASGRRTGNRTGINTISDTGHSVTYDLAEGFPAVTTRKLAFKTSRGELVGFMRATSSAKGFRELGCKVWDQNANETQAWLDNPYRKGEDDLGNIYGVQWRRWPAYKQVAADRTAELNDALGKGYEIIAERVVNGAQVHILYKEIDQLRECLDAVMFNPESRRILFHGWNPAELDQMALPPCHLLYQFHPDPERRELSMTLFIRSSDLGLGNPLNTSEAACLMHLFGRLTGYTPRFLHIMIGDAHVYENQLEMVNTQCERDPLSSPSLRIADRVPSYAETGVYAPEWLDKVEPSDFTLEGYEHHPPLTAPMAV